MIEVAPLVLAVSGAIASGKSTIATLLSDQLRWRLASFGNYVRRVAAQRGRDQSRETLQALGVHLIAGGWTAFCVAVLAEAGWREGEPIIVDGIRHPEALTALRCIVSPLPVILVHVTTTPAVRRDRLRSRGLDDPNEVERLEKHPTEIEVPTTLFEIADLRVDGTRPADEVAAEIIKWMRCRSGISNSR